MPWRENRSVPVFYGWYILAACVLIELFGLGFGVFAITTVYPFIIDTFPDWPRTTVFLPTSIIIATVGAMGPITGAFIDRFSIRILFVAGILVQSAALYLFSKVDTPAEYLAVSALVGLGMSGVTILPNQVLVSRWFHARVGLVNGVILSATALGAAMAPALITRIIAASDWRAAFEWMAVLALVPPLIAVLALVRDHPADMGLEPYGAHPTAPPAADQRRDRPGTDPGVRLGEAMSSPVFWFLGAAVFFAGMPCYSYNKHILVHLKELGYSPVQAADYKSFFFLIAAGSRLSFGWLCDRFDKRRMMLLHCACIAAGYPLLLFIGPYPQLLIPCLLIVGIGYGGLLPAMPILSVTYFGRAHLGTILGVYKISYDVAASGAPLLTAYLFDRYATYAVPDVLNTVFAWIGVALVAIGVRAWQPVSAPAVPLATARR
jgi:sugar phosphate permease